MTVTDGWHVGRSHLPSILSLPSAWLRTPKPSHPLVTAAHPSPAAVAMLCDFPVGFSAALIITALKPFVSFPVRR